uniref:Acidic endochitinase n=1 Tax=Medicago truncatula TaxID=3880 RepID=I3SFM4_MEDTR|nr:unknown [Medicago truncatula]
MSNKYSYPSLLLLSISLTLFFQSTNAGDLVIYWGQDNGDGSLRDTCNTGLFNIVNIAFLSTFGSGRQPQLNLAGHCNPPNCKNLRDSINICQSRGIKVMLSIGGEDRNTYSFSSPEDANQLADYIWNNFLGGNSPSRPFGDAILDGVDFDIEGGSKLHYETLALKLNDHYKSSRKKFYLTAAPLCIFQDNILQTAINTGLFDYVWVQFYNSPGACNFVSNNPTSFKNSWSQWINFMFTKKVFVGLPASSFNAAPSGGFVEAQDFINQLLPIVKPSPKYGGVMLWNRRFDVTSGYSSKIKASV